MTTVLGLLKSGKLRPRRTTDRGDLIKLLGEWFEKFDLVTRKFFSTETAQSVRNEEAFRDRSGRLNDINSQEEARPQNFVIGNVETEYELSAESRSFVNRVDDQVRKRQKRISKVTEDGEKHSMIWGMFMAATMESATFMGKNFQNNRNSITNTTDLTLKQMFDISLKLVSEQDEISGLETNGWENHSWKYLSKIGDERVINLQRTKVYVFSDSVLCLRKIQQNPESNKAWEERLGWITSSQRYRNFDRIDGEPMKLEWNIFPGFDTLQLCDKVKSLLSRLGETPETFTGNILFMSMFNDISCGTRDNEQECLANAKLVSLYARRFGKGHWSFMGLGSEKKWYSISEDRPQGICDNLAEKMLIEFAESGCPIFRATTPLSRGQLKSKGRGKLSIHFAAVQETIETIFRIIVSAIQLNLYGAVAEICEEYESLHERKERPVMMGQSSSSLVLSAIKTEVPLESDDPAYQNFLLQQYGERIEKLCQQDKLNKFNMDAGFLSVVESGQYFMTKDTGDLTQFHAVACREYTLPREDEASQPKGWIQETPKLDPCWKLQPVICTVNMELRSELCL